MSILCRIARLASPKAIWAEKDGAILAEALLAVPFMTLFAVGILEFGNIFWERIQVETGLRDAARYMARCRLATESFPTECNADDAKRIAFYGTQTPAVGAALRVPGWGPTLTDITIGLANADGVFTVSTSHDYVASPLFGWLGINQLKINSSHQEKYMGW